MDIQIGMVYKLTHGSASNTARTEKGGSMGRPATFSDGIKGEAVAAYLGGESAIQLAKGLGCSTAAIRRWAKEPRFVRNAMLRASKAKDGAVAAVPDPGPPPATHALFTGITDDDLPDIEAHRDSLQQDVERWEARLAILRTEVEKIEKHLPRLKAALLALQEP